MKLNPRLLLDAGDTYKNGSTGGEATHNHDVNSAHALISAIGGGGGGITSEQDTNIKTFGDGVLLINTTGQTGHNYNGMATKLYGNTSTSSNMPPYLAVYIWKRVS